MLTRSEGASCPNPPHVYYLCAPERGAFWWTVSYLVGAGPLWFAALWTASFVHSAFKAKPGISGQYETLFFFGAMGAGLVMNVLFAMLIYRLAARPIRKRRPRVRSLRAMLSRREGAARFPHRRLELALLSTHRLSRVTGKLLAELPPGHVMLVDMPVVISYSADSFEPIDLFREPDRLVQLSVGAVERWTPAEAALNAGLLPGTLLAETVQKRRPARTARRVATMAVRVVTWALICVWLSAILVAVIRQSLSCWHFWPIFFFLPLVGVALRVFAPVRDLYLIPGGLMFVGGDWWTSALMLYRYTPQNTPLVMDYNARQDVVTISLRAGRQMLQFPMHPTVASGFLVGWMSIAPPPTDEQMRSFLSVTTRV